MRRSANPVANTPLSWPLVIEDRLALHFTRHERLYTSLASRTVFHSPLVKLVTAAGRRCLSSARDYLQMSFITWEPVGISSASRHSIGLAATGPGLRFFRPLILNLGGRISSISDSTLRLTLYSVFRTTKNRTWRRESCRRTKSSGRCSLRCAGPTAMRSGSGED